MISETPSQPRLGRSSVAAALQEQPSTQLVVFVASLFEVLLAAPRGHEEGCSSTSRRDAAAPRGGGRAARSISSVAAASAPSQQQKQATAVSRDHERSTGREHHWAAPRIVFATVASSCLFFELMFLKSLDHSPDKGSSIFFEKQ